MPVPPTPKRRRQENARLFSSFSRFLMDEANGRVGKRLMYIYPNGVSISFPQGPVFEAYGGSKVEST
jgi:hypothetical protein